MLGLKLDNITKIYKVATDVVALREVSIGFRKNEFVSILGPSGCGKTTMLNIIGGLDRYTSGDLVINGVSTKEYRDVDWDIYRNNSIGFVFQNYNLITHQSVLSNVELAMTLAGKSRTERRRRAAEVLEKVGLGDQLGKKPTQMSGGQMQRVAIARALVNDPDILLADEPTGALDSETSLQIMELLKEIARDRLVIMVTHNSELAQKYSTRIIKLLDGKVVGDSDPLEETAELVHNPKKKKKKISMSFLTALALSFKNLMTKKTRTILTAFAGSIGIIGIALILSLSSGMHAYIERLEKDTLSTYPLMLESQAVDMTNMMNVMMAANNKDGVDHDLDKVYASNIMTDMMESMSAQTKNNDLKRFKEFLESEKKDELAEITNSVQYGYDIRLQVYKTDTSDGVLRVFPSDVFSQAGARGMARGANTMAGGGMMSSFSLWTRLLDNDDIVHSQYEVISGRWPENYDEIVLLVDENNEISDYVLYSLGLLDGDVLEDMMEKIARGEKLTDTTEEKTFTYEELMAQKFSLVLNSDYYEKENNIWKDRREDNAYMKGVIEKALPIKVVGIIRPDPGATAASITGAVAYTSALTDYVIEAIQTSEIAKEQNANPGTNVFTGISFDTDSLADNLTMDDVRKYLETMPEAERAQAQGMLSLMPEEQVIAMFAEQIRNNEDKATYEGNLSEIGFVDFAKPSDINLYPKDFESKEKLIDLISDYNNAQKDSGNEEYTITYTDYVGLMTSSVSNIIDIITYVLIAFVAISLVVSSIMIGIITYISVLERTKEIGILRSIGASKRDITRVFNAETVIEGFVAGGIGVAVTILLNVPINIIIKHLTDISSLSGLPVWGGFGLVGISIVLTLIAGFIPSKVAAKKDPVEALRTE